MAFFSSTYPTATISQPKMRQEGFHLPSPSPSNGNPPSPPSATSTSAMDMYMPHHSSYHNSNNSPTSAAGSNSNHSPHSAGANAHFSGLIPDAFSRAGAGMDFSDELASLIASSPATSNERTTHTPPYDHHAQGGANGPSTSSAADGGPSGSAYNRPTHNIFDISAPSSAHYAGAGAHAFSLPHTSHRPEIPPMSQPSSVHTSHLHHAYDHHPNHHHNDPYHSHHPLGRDGFPAHFNSTIPPLSTHHDPPIPPEHQQHQSHQQQNHPPPPSAYANPYSPASSGGPARDTPSPGASSVAAVARPGTRSDSRSRSRARGTSVSATGPGACSSSVGGAGPTRTTKSSSKRRDSFTIQHTGHHMLHHNTSLPSPPASASSSVSVSNNPNATATSPNGLSRPQAIVIPSQHPFGASSTRGHGPSSPLGMMSMSASAAGMGIGVGQTSGWFLPSAAAAAAAAAATPGSAPSGVPGPNVGAEYGLPTPESVGHGHAFGQFGTSIGSMGISPKDTTLGAKGESPPVDAVMKQAAIVSEKRRRRRESHNAVERRRRDNINEKISELATLIPEVMLNPTVPSSSLATTAEEGEQSTKEDGGNSSNANANTNGNGSEDGNSTKAGSVAGGDPKDTGPVKANKGMILRKSVEYIRYLQQLVNAQAARNRQLEERLARAGIEDEKDSLAQGQSDSAASVSANDGTNTDALGAALANNGASFPDDVLNLHSFGADGDDVSYMGMGFGSFSEAGVSGMEMDGDVDVAMGLGGLGGLGGMGNSNSGGGSGNTGSYQVRSPTGDREGTSPSAGSEEDDRDEEGRGSVEPRMGMMGLGMGGMGMGMSLGMMGRKDVEEARGRRDREGRVRTAGMAGVGVVTVKEESQMEL